MAHFLPFLARNELVAGFSLHGETNFSLHGEIVKNTIPLLNTKVNNDNYYFLEKHILANTLTHEISVVVGPRPQR
jgi:hypothetical protein